ncbi:hypothetical protein [Vagococcus lutrae]|uniref:hypothetical protein n=1 Tax=Vagococcus lutrae TaxID=81947 RepID=UPI002891F20C|nr:hypothetical protein [Vagococcus lutrae]MDT2844683.1 hypothetical protein [Vagococcus lutrae]
MLLTNFLRRKKELRLLKQAPYIKKWSNVIQYDDMGYPLRLIINKYSEQVWIDTVEIEGDLVLSWEFNMHKVN